MNTFVRVCLCFFFGTFIGSKLLAQETELKLHKYRLEKPYKVHRITAPSKLKKPKNVVLMIGDGMSLMHIYTAATANRGQLFLDNCPVVGLAKTTCANRLITDSGAAATAMAAGQKTNYHAVGVDSLGRAVKTIFDFAKEKGLATGMSVTCRLWDATPASFACHNKDRDADEEVIIADYLSADLDYVFGGGAMFFENRKDKRNIFNELASQGYSIIRSMPDLEETKARKVFAVPYKKDVPLPSERGDLLARATLKGLNLLKSKSANGFIMMVEESQLDDYGHFNDLSLLMQEMHDFDRTIGRVLEWAAKDGETLVIITADHETGGLTLLGGNQEQGEVTCHFSTKGHSGVRVPVFAFGVGAEHFSGIYENTELFHKIKQLLQL